MRPNTNKSDDLVRFPTTNWSMIEAVRGPMTPVQREVLNGLIERYWQPVYAYIVGRGWGQEAADLAQEFFVHTLQKQLFGRAEQARGRFRTFLLACLNNFLGLRQNSWVRFLVF
jgi:RNA polymerase sigma-70 factor (ECF subfamily)